MKKDDRRSFLKKITISGFGAAVVPGTAFEQQRAGIQDNEPGSRKTSATTAGKTRRAYNSPYTGEYLNRLAFPIGGIGAGMFCLEGTGAISHMSVRHKPEIFHEPGMFAAICVKGIKKGTKVIEGPVPDWKKFGQAGSGNGSAGTIYGLPRFNHATFTTRFPFGYIDLADEDIPVAVRITGWSPFIPTDENNSSLPAGALEYRFVNKGKEQIDAVFSYNSRNFIIVDKGKGSVRKIANGFVLSQEGTTEKPSLRGDFAIFTDHPGTVVDHCWFRGGWWDPLTMAWNTIKNGNVRSNEPVESGAPGASLFVKFTLKPGQERIIRTMMAWYVPGTELHIGKDADTDKKNAIPSPLCFPEPVDTTMMGNIKDVPATNYKPWYSSRFSDVHAVAKYWQENYSALQKKSLLFKDAFYASTLPAEVIEAVAANLTILKSPTVMRQHDGRLWCFEGCGDSSGCCHGSCTHVWNYAQAIPHLFPALERSLRHTEFCENQDAEGHQMFRANLPIRPVKHDFHAAADGQLGGIMKAYREWRISGDNAWLAKLYPLVKNSMDYCIRTWDPGNKGILEEPHHNTYDIEFWGPDGMCTSFYLGALQAITRMGKFLEHDTSIYEQLYAKGRKYMETELYDGEFFIQKIQYSGLQAEDPVKASEKSIYGGYSDEARSLLQKEGPKYQYGNGCLSDGVLGSWISEMCGMDNPLDNQKTKSHLMAVYKHNFKKDLSDHANPQRPSYALGSEGGLLLCSWPKEGKLSLPFVYSDEVWTGIEYQVASHLLLMGQLKEGLEIVRTCRDRYDGRTRNPFNEYECGNWYARAMSSYGLIEALTGVRYDAVDKTLHIDSKVGDFTSFLSTETGFGTITVKKGSPTMRVVYGSIPVKQVFVSGKIAKLWT